MLARYLLLWFILPLIGILNGTIREALYAKPLGTALAHQLSTLTGILLFGWFIWYVTKRWRLESAGQAVAVGLIWLVLTVLFEFTFGHYVAKHSWSALLEDYNILEGHLWPLVLIWIAVAPWLFYRLHLKKDSHRLSVK